MKPACHNRAPFGPGYWMKTSTIAMGKRRPSVTGRGLHVYRWIEHRFDDVCGTWLGTGVGPNGEPYPQTHGWDCKGCRLDPHRVIHSPTDFTTLSVETSARPWSIADEVAKNWRRQQALNAAANQGPAP